MEIGLARGRVDRYAALMLVVHTLLFAAARGRRRLAPRGEWLGGVGAGLRRWALAVAWLGWSGLYVFAWIHTRKIDVPMGAPGRPVSSRGRTYGELVIPWNHDRLGHRRADLVGPAAAGPLGPRVGPRAARGHRRGLAPAEMMRVVEKHGIRCSLRALDIGVDELRQAFLSRSGGLVTG